MKATHDILGYGALTPREVASLLRTVNTRGWEVLEKWLGQMQVDLGKQSLTATATAILRDQLAAQNHWAEIVKKGFKDHVEEVSKSIAEKREKEQKESS